MFVILVFFVVFSTFFFFFFNDTSPTEIYTLSLHDALPIYRYDRGVVLGFKGSSQHLLGEILAPRSGLPLGFSSGSPERELRSLDRKSTRLNSSHVRISYAVFCLKKKKKKNKITKQNTYTTI